MNETNNPGIQLDNILKNDNLIDLSSDYAEIAIDGILNEGLLKDIPAVGTVIGLVKFGNSVNQFIFAKKIYKYLFELKSISQEDRKRKIDEINNSKKYQSKVGQIIIELLDKVESDYKPEILGKLMKAVIEERINFKMYLRLAHIVKSMYIDDLVEFKNSSKDIKSKEAYITDEMSSYGLIEYNDFPELKPLIRNGVEIKEDTKDIGFYRSLTDLGKALSSYG